MRKPLSSSELRLLNLCNRFINFFLLGLVRPYFFGNLCCVIYLVMSIKKSFLKTKPQANVTFELPAEAAEGASKVTLVGEFNDWSETATELKKLKSGVFKTTLKLETGKEYQFRYLIDGEKWENDWAADKYVANEISFDENSVVAL